MIWFVLESFDLYLFKYKSFLVGILIYTWNVLIWAPGFWIWFDLYLMESKSKFNPPPVEGSLAEVSHGDWTKGRDEWTCAGLPDPCEKKMRINFSHPGSKVIIFFSLPASPHFGSWFFFRRAPSWFLGHNFFFAHCLPDWLVIIFFRAGAAIPEDFDWS